ncbi:hypothetical protein [Micromonospora okii]|uniref:hypothetical protein n=1 Tax=Micromonospora okii TaxID=1182970 RepID=UPI001E394A64|nr:hypothetical protein [Micromonospora okii]
MAQESPLSATGALHESQYEMMAAATQPDGLIGHPSDPAPVRVSGGQVIVRAGLEGALRGFPWRSGDTDTVYTPPVAGPARTDLVVLRLNRPDGYAVHTAYREGTSTFPPEPASGTGPDTAFEIPLAEIGVSAAGLTVRRIRAWYLGPDGQILCTGDSLPPHSPGRRVRRIDTGQTLESNGTSWVPLLDDSGNVAFPFAGGWSASIKTMWRRNGSAFLALSPQRTGAPIAANAPVLLGTLPDGFKPVTAFEANLHAPSSGPGRYSVSVNGRIEVVLYGGLTKDKFINMDPVTYFVGPGPLFTPN